MLMILEMADINAFAYVAPTVRAQWGLSVDEVASITASAFLGMSVGALVGGVLADRFGRKRMLVLGTVFYSLASLGCAFAESAGELMVYRFLVGFGLYTVTICALTFIAEMFPQRQRGRVQALVLAIALLGIPMMSWFSRWVVPQGDEAWRWVFVLGALGLVGALVSQWLLPESVRWQEARDRATLAEPIVAQLERESASLLEVDEATTVPAASDKATFGEFVRSGYVKRTVVLSLVLGLSSAVFYGFNSWIPVLLTEHGFSNTSSLTYTSILALAACPGALSAMLFIDKVERRTAIMVVFLAIGAMLLVFGFTGSLAILLTSGVVLCFLLYCSTAIAYAYTPEIFPTRFRALGTGIANSIGRLSAFGAMFAVAAILGNIGFTAVFAFLATAIASAALIIGIFGERTYGRTIDEVASAGGRTRSSSARVPETA
ncbi:MFS transporter [Rhodococcus sp. B50]|uniref:MFS transporter n=1 Tax=Rhodococcus sp. B50 TaxID=2682847 RepID=UPI001FD1BFB3|nr:MFS transporter [Rhodococcus sp. B50]